MCNVTSVSPVEVFFCFFIPYGELFLMEYRNSFFANFFLTELIEMTLTLITWYGSHGDDGFQALDPDRRSSCTSQRSNNGSPKKVKSLYRIN